jgi:hypothetical protein
LQKTSINKPNLIENSLENITLELKPVMIPPNKPLESKARNSQPLINFLSLGIEGSHFPWSLVETKS